MPLTSTLWVKVKFVLIRKILPGIIFLLYAALPRKKGRVLVIKADGIGDYLLFRNFLPFLKGSQKYRHSQLYLTVNASSSALARHLDGDIVKEFFIYSDGYFLKWDLVCLLWRLQGTRFETIIYPNYSRSFHVDWLIRNVSARYKIGVDGDCINEPAPLKKKGNLYYSTLIDAGSASIHEFERNKQIFELITFEKYLLSRPFLEKNKLEIIPNKAIVVFPGASNDSKKWPIERFYSFCFRAHRELKADLIVVPGKNEAIDGRFAGLNLPGHSFRVAGNLDMVALCSLIGSSALLVSGDTVAVHIAAALGVPAVCICKGDLYGRFVPYPADVFDELLCVLPRNIDPRNLRYDLLSPAKIDEVEVEDVFDAVAKAWAQKKIV
ncbi:glycosyltransferase family 9 protein [Mucilaginibacter sp.]